jgi:hypothetical protein
MNKSEYSKAKSYAEASATDTLNYFLKYADSNIGHNEELIKLAIAELEKRECTKYCEGMDFERKTVFYNN